MDCARWTDALSAIADGEDPGIDRRLVDAHVRRCASCRAFRDGLEGSRHSQPGRDTPASADLGRRIAAGHAAADRASRPRWLRAALVVLAVQIIVLSAEPLLLGDEAGTSPHGARHLGAFSVAYAVGLLLVSARPSRARTMVPVAIVLAGALVLSTLVDVVDGQITITSELAHLPELLSLPALLLCADPSRLRTGPPPDAGNRTPSADDLTDELHLRTEEP